MYDDHNDVALLIVEAEDPPPEVRHAEGAEGPGGFLKDDLLLNTRVSKEEKYDRQQGTYARWSESERKLTSDTGTLIVWTDHTTQQDIALSFQDVEGCDDIWQFIVEVQKHLSNQFGEISAESSPLIIRRRSEDDHGFVIFAPGDLSVTWLLYPPAGRHATG